MLHVSGIVQYVVFRVWLLSLSVMLRFIHVVLCIGSLLLFIEQYSIIWLYYTLLIGIWVGSSLGILGGHPASICLGIQSQGNCHASACSGIHHLVSQEVDLPQPPYVSCP